LSRKSAVALKPAVYICVAENLLKKKRTSFLLGIRTRKTLEGASSKIHRFSHLVLGVRGLILVDIRSILFLLPAMLFSAFLFAILRA
jgi:hypothetical protein